MKLSSNFCQKLNKRKEFLIENLNKMAIWSEKFVWIQLFDHFCSIYMERLKEASEVTNQSIFNKLRQNFLGNDEDKKFTVKVKEDALDDLGNMLFNLKFSYEFIAETLIQVTEEFGMEKRGAFRILRKNEDKLTRELFDKIRAIDLNNTNSDKIKSDRSLNKEDVLVKTLVYLTAADGIELGLACKSLWKRIKLFLPSKILITERCISNKARTKIWSKFIIREFANESLQDLPVCEEDEIILLDVKRTFPHHKSFDKELLIKILKNIRVRLAGAVCYYQGMNYLAGYILHITKNPTTTYRLTLSLLRQHISKFVCDDLRNMKIAFYVFGRLIQLFLPNISEKLRNEKVSVEIFSASWFLTIFTTVAQSDPDSGNLRDIFDLFVAGGWPEFFKCVLLIIKSRKEDIEKMNYEEIMMVFFNINKSSLFRNLDSQKSIIESEVEPALQQRSSSSSIGSEDCLSARSLRRVSDAGLEYTWPDIDFKRDTRRVKITQNLIETLFTEHKSVAKQIEAFWATYDS